MAVSYLNYGTESYYVGMSKDEKPLDVSNGSLFHEINTSQDYRYNSNTKSWELQQSNRWWMTIYD